MTPRGRPSGWQTRQPPAIQRPSSSNDEAPSLPCRSPPPPTKTRRSGAAPSPGEPSNRTHHTTTSPCSGPNPGGVELASRRVDPLDRRTDATQQGRGRQPPSAANRRAHRPRDLLPTLSQELSRCERLRPRVVPIAGATGHPVSRETRRSPECANHPDPARFVIDPLDAASTGPCNRNHPQTRSGLERTTTPLRRNPSPLETPPHTRRCEAPAPEPRAAQALPAGPPCTVRPDPAHREHANRRPDPGTTPPCPPSKMAHAFTPRLDNDARRSRCVRTQADRWTPNTANCPTQRTDSAWHALSRDTRKHRSPKTDTPYSRYRLTELGCHAPNQPPRAWTVTARRKRFNPTKSGVDDPRSSEPAPPVSRETAWRPVSFDSPTRYPAHGPASPRMPPQPAIGAVDASADTTLSLAA